MKDKGDFRILLEQCDGRVPDDMEALLELPGVGRKTANCVFVDAFLNDALTVDTPFPGFLTFSS